MYSNSIVLRAIDADQELETENRFDEIEFPLVSIIILTFNSIQFIEQCLTTVYGSNYRNFEVILVDNGSSDETVAAAKRISNGKSNFRFFQNERNSGFADGNNIGARLAKGEYIVFLNADTEVDSKWIGEIVRFFESDSRIGIVQAKLLQLTNRKRIDSVGDYLDYYGRAISLGGDWGEIDIGQYDKPRQIFSARGAAMAIRKVLFRELAGFDRSFFLDYEDIDLCWRARINGATIFYVPTAIVYHRGMRETDERDAARTFHPVKNRFVSLLKNYTLENIVRFVIPYFAIIFVPTMLVDLVRNRRKVFLQRLRALSWIVSNIRMIVALRYFVQFRLRRVSDLEVQKFMMKTSLSRELAGIVMIKEAGKLGYRFWYAKPLLDSIRAQETETFTSVNP